MERVTTLTLGPVEDALTDARARTLEELFEAHQARLYRLARRLSRNSEDARDLVQEAFLRLARHTGVARSGSEAVEGWLVRVLVNLSRDRNRRERVRRRHAAAAPPARIPRDPSESAAVARLTVEAALSKLAPRRRAVIVLHELEELDTADVARLLGLSQVTVRWHLHAARRQLRAFLEGEGKRHVE